MTDDKRGRNKQAADEDRRQRERELQETLDRGDEADPGRELGELDAALETQNYPTTTEELIETYGDYEVETQNGWKSIEEVLAPIDDEPYDSPEDIRDRIQRLINRR